MFDQLRIVSDDLRFDGRRTRRDVLRLGGLAGLSLLGGGLSATAAHAASNARQPAGFGRARSVIFIYASGGQSQIDTWDPKPEAPAEVRGKFASIETSLGGVRLCEHMPRLARLADRYTMVRSMSHADLDHGSATYLTLTGQYHARRSSNPLPSPDDHPCHGAVLQKVRRTNRFPYEAIHLNGPAVVPNVTAPGQDAGFLGRRYEPLVLGDVSKGSIAVPGLAPQRELPPLRLSARENLRHTLQGYCRALEGNRAALDMDQLYRQAFELLATPECQQAFDLTRETPDMRRRYGLHRSGQACLLARRLVEAGVPMITVIFNHNNRGQDLEPGVTDLYGWDTHNDIFTALEQHLLPRFDATFAALLEDLDERGLLDDTLVVCSGEFGRAPLVAFEERFAGRSPGRKHWANVYSAVLAGAGVRRGAVVGSSDRLGGSPDGESYGPWDLGATMLSALGIDTRGHFTDAQGRPFNISTGRPIGPLYGG